MKNRVVIYCSCHECFKYGLSFLDTNQKMCPAVSLPKKLPFPPMIKKKKKV